MEADVAAREKKAAAVEKKVEASQITDGTWSVGSDVQPGTYRTTDTVTSDCYWEITTGGGNGSDIIQNDIPGGGYPVVAIKTVRCSRLRGAEPGQSSSRGGGRKAARAGRPCGPEVLYV